MATKNTTNRSSNSFRPFYPDILGTVTGGKRFSMEKLQIAVGVFPQQVFLNQPFETLIVLQNMVDQAMQVKVALRLPTSSKGGKPVLIDTPKSQISLKLDPGEVGILRMPVVARPPTPPNDSYPMRVAVRFRVPEDAQFVRPPSGGPPSSMLSISPFKLQVLRDVAFNAHSWNESAEIVTAQFDLAAQQMPKVDHMPKVRYEPLWKHDVMPQEVQQARRMLDEARALADPAQHGSAYPALRQVTEERFASYGLPLHPAEVMAIAMMMAYTLDEAPTLEPDVDIERTRWFVALCQVLASATQRGEALEMEYDRHEIIAHFVYEELLYESIMMAFKVLQSKVDENLGSMDERLQYAQRFMQWTGGRGEADLNYIYMPLVLGGLSIYRLVRYGRNENPWRMVDGLHEAMQGRIRLVDDAGGVVFDMLETLLESASRVLHSQRIQRP